MDLTRSLYDGHCRIRKRFLIEEDIIMKRKKLTGTIAAATLVMGMLAGCGASDTAAASSAVATHAIPPWMTGYSIPKISVILVFIQAPVSQYQSGVN